MVDGFREGTFKLLAFIETKLKSNGEVLWGKLKGITAGIQEIKRAGRGYEGCVAQFCN